MTARGRLAIALLLLHAGGAAAVFAQTPPALAAATPATTAPPAPAKGDRELGEYLSSQCTTCHLLSGKSVGAIPPIIGWPEDQFIAVIQSYRQGERDNETMRTIARQFSNEDISALAAYFGSLTPTK